MDNAPVTTTEIVNGFKKYVTKQNGKTIRTDYVCIGSGKDGNGCDKMGRDATSKMCKGCVTGIHHVGGNEERVGIRRDNDGKRRKYYENGSSKLVCGGKDDKCETLAINGSNKCRVCDGTKMLEGEKRIIDGVAKIRKNGRTVPCCNDAECKLSIKAGQTYCKKHSTEA